MSLQPFTFDQPRGHIGSGWKAPTGKLLTDRRIKELQELGFYRHYGKGYILPPRSAGDCLKCRRPEHTKRYSFDYLDTKGIYCLPCIATLRKEHQLEQELRRKLRKARLSEFEALVS